MTRDGKLDKRQVTEEEMVEFAKGILTTENSLILLNKYPEIFDGNTALGRYTTDLCNFINNPTLQEHVAANLNLQNPDFFDVLIEKFIDFVREYNKPPEWLINFAVDVLRGNRKRPTKRGKNINDNLSRDFTLWLTAYAVKKKFNLQYYSGGSEFTAANIVSKATKEIKDGSIRYVSVDTVTGIIKKNK